MVKAIFFINYTLFWKLALVVEVFFVYLLMPLQVLLDNKKEVRKIMRRWENGS